jgi:hypothetical protein
MPNSPYDALLEPPATASPYDALLTQPSPYDALLDSSPAASNPSDPNKAKRLKIGAAQYFDEVAPGLREATSPQALASLTSGVDYSKDPAQRMAEKEVATPQEAMGDIFNTSPIAGVLPRPQHYRADVQNPISQAISGATESGENLIEGLGTGGNLILMGGMGGAPGVVKRLAQLGFAAQFAKSLPEHKEAIGNAETPFEKAKAISDFILAAGMTAAAGKEGIFGEAPHVARPAGAPQEELDAAGSNAQLQQLAPPETIQEPKAQGSPEILDGLHIARRKLAATPKEFAALPPEVQANRQSEIDNIDQELLRHDRTAVSESADRTAPEQSTTEGSPPATGEVQASPPVEPNAFQRLKQMQSPAERAVAPILSAAESAQDVAPQTAKAAEQIAATIADKAKAETEPALPTGNKPTEQVEPAVELPNGQVTTGEDHVDAYAEAKKETPDTSGAKEGFVDEKGDFISREEAADKTGLPTETEPGKLHSSDLPKNRGTFKPEALSKFMAELGEEEPVPEPTPVNQAKPRNFSVKRAKRDLNFAADPIIQTIENNGGIISKTEALKRFGQERFSQHKGEWDDAPTLSDSSHNSIYNPEAGLMPNEMVGALIERGLLPPGSTEAEMWKAIGETSKASDSLRRQQAAETSKIKGFEKQQKDFVKSAKDPKGGNAIPADALKEGDTVTVQGEKMSVIHVDEDGAVTLEDGKRFGIQQRDAGDTIYGELTSGPEANFEDWPELDPVADASKITTTQEADEHIEKQGLAESESGQPVADSVDGTPRGGQADAQGQGGIGEAERGSLPKLKPGQKEAELLQGDNEAFNLVSETAKDKAARLAREAKEDAEKAAKASAEAKALQDKQQTGLFDQPEKKPLSREETIAALQRELDSARDEDRTHDVTRLKKRIKELSAEPKEAAQEAPEEQPEEPKEIWQKTRDEIESNGGSLAKHRIEVRKAVAEGKEVPLEVLEDYKKSAWADKAREEKYGQQISDSLLTKILKGLSDDPDKQFSDPLFIQSVGKPALRAAVKILQASIEAGKLGHDAVTDAINYLKEKIPTLNEDKANEFFDQFFEKAAPESQPEPPRVEAQDKLGVGEAASETAAPENSRRALDSESGDKLTSTQHAATEAERAARGAGEREQQGRQAFGDIWDKAKQEIDFSRNRAPELVKEINDKPRSTTALEEAILLRHKVSVMNELDGHIARALDETADPQERTASRVESARLMDELNEIDCATSLSGSETGRSLRFRQVLAAQDYSLVKMLQRKQLAMGDAWDGMTEEQKTKQTEQVKKMSDRIASLEKQLAEHQTNLEEEREKTKNQGVDQAITQIQREQTPAEKYAQGLVEKIQKGLKTEADKARERIRARLSRASAGLDPTVLYDVAVIGAEKLFNVGLDFAKWSHEMIADIGDSIQPHLEEIFDKSKAINDEAIEKGAPKPVREKVKAKVVTDADKRTAIVETIRNKKGVNEAIGSQIQKLAESFVRSGITEREALVDAVHDAVKEALPDASRRDIRDAISGYGDFKELSKDEIKAKLRDLKGQMQQVSKIEDITAEGKARKTGVQRRIPTAEERRLLAEVNRVKKEYGIDTDDPEALKSALGASKTRLRNRIEDLKTAIAKKEKLAAKGKKLVDDDETVQLRKDKDALQKEYEAVFAIPKKTPEEIALAAYKTRTQTRINDLNDRLARNDFSKAPKKELKLDAEGMSLKQKSAAAKLDFDRAVFRDKQKNRKWWETALDTTAKTERAFLLSNPVTLAKLTAAAAWRLGITPMEELAGAGLGKIPFVSEIAARAPREGGGLNLRAEGKSLTEGFTKGMKDAWQKLTKGETELDAAGGKRSIADHHWIDFIGNVHGALKTPVVRAEFARSFEKRSRFYMDNGVDVTDPMVQARITLESYADAQRSIFSQDNRVVSIYNAALKMLEAPSKATGRTPVGGKLGAFGLKTIFPIVKIPTNIVAEAMQYATGSITGSAKVAGAFKRGIETLKPEEADLIMRHLKKGSLGAAAMTLGFLAPQVIGGYYQKGIKRKDDDVKAGGVRLYGQYIPKTVLHAPLLEALQVGSTIRRVADSKLRKKDTGPQGVSAGVQAAALGLTEEVPFVRDTLELSKAFDPYERWRYFDELVKSRTVPQLSQWLAEHMDQRNGQTVKRDPQSLTETLKTGVPGLREQVPEKRRGRITSRTRPWPE